MLLDRQNSLLLVIDVQEKLAPATDNHERVVENGEKLMTAASRLDVPILVSEQYPKGLGATLAPLRRLAPDGAIIDKVHFSCADDDRIRGRIEESGRRQIVLAGMEAHVCVAQTALALKEAGYAPAVVADAITSRDPANKALAIERLQQAGVTVVPTESVLFEWMHSSQDPSFKDLSKLIR